MRHHHSTPTSRSDSRLRGVGLIGLVALGVGAWGALATTASAQAVFAPPAPAVLVPEAEQGDGSNPPDAPLELDPPSDMLPVRHGDRSLNLPERVIRGGGTFRIVHNGFASPNDTLVSLSLGGAMGITDDVEVGIDGERLGNRHAVIDSSDFDFIPEGLLPLALTPDFEFGDIPVYGRFHLSGSDDRTIDVALEAGLLVPVQTDFTIWAAVLVRARAFTNWTFDTGMQIDLRFGDDTDNDPHLTLWAPISAIWQVADPVFLAIRSGLSWRDFDDIILPLGFEFGYTIASGERPLMDVLLGFGFPAFLVPTSDGDRAPTNVWQITIGGRVFLPI